MKRALKRGGSSLFGSSAFIAMMFLLPILSSSSLGAGVYPDPACEQQCHDDYIFCLDYYCDPRGTCTCWTDYQSCVSYCPQICEEPRSVRDYTKTVYINRQITSTTSCFIGLGAYAKVHNRILYQQRTDTYRETTHCDGTKTTQLLSTGTPSGQLACWMALYPPQYCSSNVYGVTCPFN